MVLNLRNTRLGPWSCAAVIFALLFLTVVPEFNIMIKNADRGGFISRYGSIRLFIESSLSDGVLPLWLPHAGFTVPLALQSEFQLFSPLEWMYWLGGENWWTLVRWLQMCAAAIGVFLVVTRRMRLSCAAGVCGALIFSLTGYSSFFWDTPSFFVAIVPLPYIIYFGDILIRDTARSGAFLGLTTSLVLLLTIGQPQIVFCVLIGLALFGALHIVRVAMAFGGGIRAVVFVLLSAVLAIIISAPHVIPFVIDQLRGDMESAHQIDLFGISASRSTDFLNIFNIVSPFLSGFLSDAWFSNPKLAHTSAEDFVFNPGFIGTQLLLLGLVGAVTRMATGTKHWIVQHAAIGFLVGFGVIVLQAAEIVNLWPFPFVTYSRYVVPLLSLFAAFLIAEGYETLDTWANDGSGGNFRKLTIALTAAIVLAVPVLEYLVIAFSPATTLLDQPHAGIYALYLVALPACILIGMNLVVFFLLRRGVDKGRLLGMGLAGVVPVFLGIELLFVQRYGLSLAEEVWRLPVYFLIAAAVVAAVMIKRQGGERLLAWGLLVAAFLWTIGCWFALPPLWFHSILNGNAANGVFSVLNREDKVANRPRYLAMPIAGTRPDWNAPHRIDSIAANMAIAPVYYTALMTQFIRPEALSQRDVRQTLKGSCFAGLSADISDNGRDQDCDIYLFEYIRNRRLFNVFSVTHLVSRDDLIGDFIRGGGEGLGDLQLTAIAPCTNANPNTCPHIYHDTQALPRAYLARAVRIVPFTLDARAARQAMAEDFSALRTRPVIETHEQDDLSQSELLLSPSTSDAGPVPASILEYGPNQATIQYEADHSSILVLNDLFHPFWRAALNGKDLHIYRVNSAVRGVIVPAGKGVVEFDGSFIWRMMAWISGCGLVALATICILLRRRPTRTNYFLRD